MSPSGGRVMVHFTDQVFPLNTELNLRLIFAKGITTHNTLTTLLWFNQEFPHRHHGNRPHIFPLGLLKKRTDFCLPKGNLIQQVYFKI